MQSSIFVYDCGMKQIIRIGVLFYVFVLLVSCAAATVAVKSEEVIYLLPELGAQSPFMRISLELTDSRNAALRPLVRNTFYEGSSPEVYMERLKNDWAGIYGGFRREATASEMEAIKSGESFASRNWEYTETFNVSASGKKMIVYRDISSYTGGAHPTYTREYYVLDTRAMKQVLLDYVILDASRTAIQYMI